MIISASTWDKHAALYERFWDRTTSLWGRDTLVLGGLNTVTDGTTPRPRFLDVACGSGSVAIAAAQLGYDVTATDFSSGMIEQLQLKLRNQSQLNVDTRVVDGQTLEGLDDEAFDVVSSIFGAFMFPNRGAAWQSALRVLKPNGQLLVASWRKDSPNVRMVGYALQNALDKDGKRPSSTPPAPMVATANRTLQADTLAEELQEFGVRDVAVHTVEHAMCFRSGEELVTALFDNGAIWQVIGTKDPESVKLSILDFCELVLDEVDPFDSARPPALHVVGSRPEEHPLWRKPFILQGIGLIATGRK